MYFQQPNVMLNNNANGICRTMPVLLNNTRRVDKVSLMTMLIVNSIVQLAMMKR